MSAPPLAAGWSVRSAPPSSATAADVEHWAEAACERFYLSRVGESAGSAEHLLLARAAGSGEIVGACEGSSWFGGCYCSRLAVAPAWRRGKGVGSALLGALEREARASAARARLLYLCTLDYQDGPTYYPHIGFAAGNVIEGLASGRNVRYFSRFIRDVAQSVAPAAAPSAAPAAGEAPTAAASTAAASIAAAAALPAAALPAAAAMAASLTAAASPLVSPVASASLSLAAAAAAAAPAFFIESLHAPAAGSLALAPEELSARLQEAQLFLRSTFVEQSQRAVSAESGYCAWAFECVSGVGGAQESRIGAIHGVAFWGLLVIHLLIVEECSRSKGAGSALLEAALQLGRERGCTRCVVETMSFQAPQFYARRGFEEVARLGGGWHQGAEIVRFVKALDGSGALSAPAEPVRAVREREDARACC